MAVCVSLDSLYIFTGSGPLVYDYSSIHISSETTSVLCVHEGHGGKGGYRRADT